MRIWLRQLREGRGLAKYEAAEKLGLSQNHYGNIENGVRQADMNMSLMIKLSEVFGLTIEEIVKLETESCVEK